MLTEKLRIACHYPDVKLVGRNDGGPLYICHNLRKIFGHDVVKHIMPHKDTNGKHGTFDLNVWVDYGEDALQMGHDVVCPKPNVYVTSDTHLGFDYRLKKAREFDWVFCNQHKAQQEFIKAGIRADRCVWMPHAFDPMAYSPGMFNPKLNRWMTETHIEKKTDVCFVGNLNDRNRVEHLDTLFKAFPNFKWGTKRFHEAAEVFNKSRIVFNISCLHELNMRFFEALGSRGLLLSDNLPEGENVFIDKKHFIGYNTKEEMVEMARYCLDPKNEEEMDNVRNAGYKDVIGKHTYLHRVKTILDTVGFPLSSERRERLDYWLSEMSAGRDVREEGWKSRCEKGHLTDPILARKVLGMLNKVVKEIAR